MKKINLLNHQGLSFEGFKLWLNQFIADKKGALPDLNDWKQIKANLDRVHVPKQQIKEVPKVVQINVPWMTSEIAPLFVQQETISPASRHFHQEWTIEDMQDIDDDMDMHLDLMKDLEYYLDKIEHCSKIPASYMLETTYNGNPVQLEMNYDKAKENDNNLNNSCSGT